MALAKCSVFTVETRGLRQRIDWNGDVWTSIMILLKAKDLLNLALTSREFYNLVMKDYVWKELCLRELKINDWPLNPAISWKSLYRAAFDYSRVGSFLVTSGELFATGVGLVCRESQLIYFGLREDLQSLSLPAKKGPWIADVHLIHCPSCDLSLCGGNVQVFDIRHCELFLEDDYLSGVWTYEQVCSFTVRGNYPWAVACAADKTQLPFGDEYSENLPNFTTIRGEPEAWLPRWKSFRQAAASCTILQSNEGLQITYFVMKAGQEGPIVGLRITHTLV
ncbi:hypothetical protein R1sor_001379 [Riccia sorocarpa]|uniref:F-box domain-containing protein n=1 Tax=Riccia sorocarpa TaxID=122646 RepID=A0ABD3GVT3_9MARC